MEGRSMDVDWQTDLDRCLAPFVAALEQAVPSLNRLGFPNRHCSDSTCWLGGGQQGWPVHIRKTCATG
jgi:hypothetical protein